MYVFLLTTILQYQDNNAYIDEAISKSVTINGTFSNPGAETDGRVR